MDGGLGINSLIGPQTIPTNWTITSQNAGDIEGQVVFVNMQNLTGGAQDDTFIFLDNTGLDGLLDGGAPAAGNVMNVSSFSSPPTIDFLTTISGTASFLGNGFINFLEDKRSVSDSCIRGFRLCG